MAKKETEEKAKKVGKEKKIKREKNKEGFVKGLKKEIKLVKWPSSKELIKYTIATVIFCIVLVAFFQCLDIILAFIKGMFN